MLPHLCMFLSTWRKRIGQMLPPKTRYSHHPRSTPSRCLRAKQKQSLSVCSLQNFCSSIPTSHQAKRCGTNCPAKGSSRKHSHSQTVFSGSGKFQALFGNRNFHKTALHVISFVTWTTYIVEPTN